MKKISIQLEELGCPSCVKKIETALKRQDGIGEVNILFNSSKAKIEYDEAIIESDKISKIISDLGYEVLSVK
ncbi:MAG: copper chaperone [Sedimentibacter sp.]|jgi:copper chaperone CopZ|nr:copper chaperone [Sedimentibacter sp.]